MLSCFHTELKCETDRRTNRITISISWVSTAGLSCNKSHRKSLQLIIFLLNYNIFVDSNYGGLVIIVSSEVAQEIYDFNIVYCQIRLRGVVITLMFGACSEIFSGSVFLYRNNYLCFDDTIEWRDILSGEGAEVVTERQRLRTCEYWVTWLLLRFFVHLPLISPH